MHSPLEIFARVVCDCKSLYLNLMEADIRRNSSFHDEANEIRQHIDAAERFGSDGWMLWNPHTTYSEAGLKPK